MRTPTMLRPLTSLWLLAAVLMEWACLQASADDGILCDRAANMDLCSQRLAQKRFLRFGRALTDDAFLRFGRQFYRIGRSYPYEDKRFLRFGRSDEEDVSDLLRAAIARAQADESYPLYRRRRSAEVSAGGAQVAGEVDSMGQAVAKRDGDETSTNDEKDKRFMRFGRDDAEKRFMRFGRGDDKRFMRFGREQQQWDDEVDKRFMRFGRDPDEEFSDEDDIQADKKFMRFGREPDKRFMRFGREPADENEYPADEGEDKDKRFMRFGRDEEKDKRFMRFGKRFMRFGREDKRFMRFGRDGQDSEDAMSEDKRFMRFGKRFMRFGKQDKEEPAKSTKAVPSS